MTDPRIVRRQRRRFRDIEAAREALARAIREQEDPWRVQELKLRLEGLEARALEAEDVLDRRIPAMRLGRDGL